MRRRVDEMDVVHNNPNALRDFLANERTFLAWIRTAIAIVALGFVVAKFGLLLREEAGGHVHVLGIRLAAVVGTILVVFGVVTAGLSLRNFLLVRDDIRRGVVKFRASLAIALAAMVTLISLLLAVYIVTTS